MQRAEWYSGARLTRVPDPGEVWRVVADAHAYWASQGVSPFDPEEAFARLGWETRCRSLVTADCNHNAMLIPLLNGGFVVLVDEALAQRAHPTRDAVRHALTHELAHTFFYAATAPPKRLLPLEPYEELFCDAFAFEMLRQPCRGLNEARV